MGLSVGDRVLIWILMPVITGIAVVLAPELFGLAVDVASNVAEAKAKEDVRDQLKGLV
jgi:hypothetical protein